MSANVEVESVAGPLERRERSFDVGETLKDMWLARAYVILPWAVGDSAEREVLGRNI